MNRKTKYYFLLRCLLISIILIASLSILLNIFDLYRHFLPILFDTLSTIARVFNTISIIALIVILGYLIYQVYLYMNSKFYRYTSINFVEAIYNGFMDIHLVFDQLRNLSDIEDLNVDMHSSSITFKKNNKYYYIKFLELFGTINNKIDSEMWSALSKPKNEFGRKVYRSKIKFPNPIRQVNEYVETFKEQTGKNVTGLVVLTGFYKTKETSDQIFAPYEVSSIIRK